MPDFCTDAFMKKSPGNYLQSLFDKAVVALQNGDAASAKKGFARISKKVIDNPMVWYNLGLSNQYLDDHHSAVQAYRKALRLRPRMSDAIVNMGVSFKYMGQPEKAISAARKVLAYDQDNLRGNNLLGTLLAEQGQLLEAQTLLMKAYSQRPDDPECRFNVANLKLTMGSAAEASQLLQPLLQVFPNERKYIELQSRIHIDLKEYDQAARLVLRLKERYGEDDGVMRLDLALRVASRTHFQVVEVCQKLLEKAPGEADLWNTLGDGYFQLGSIEKAKANYQKAISIDPNQAKYANNLGLAHSSLGDKERAETFYRKSIALNPGYAEAYQNLVAMKRFRSMDDVDAKTVMDLWESRGDDTHVTMLLGFTLGKIFDDCGLYEKSFEVYDIGNALKFADSSDNLEAYFSHIDRIPKILDRPPVCVADEQFDSCPIFVLGMPRSGTTLVEQIIARHPDVTGCGELPGIEKAINRLEKKADPPRVYPDDFWEIAQHELIREAREYQASVDQLHEVRTPYYVDKMPFNFVHVWLIRSLFPNAPIVNCQRHPLDVIVSNYFQLYSSDVSFVYNLEALGNYYVRYFRLMQYWNEIFGGSIYNVSYEDLVTDHERQVRLLIGHIGLSWNDYCLDSRKSDTAVRTASIWQVRQGIYTSSKARWRKYRKQLQPAAEILVKAGILDENSAFG